MIPGRVFRCCLAALAISCGRRAPSPDTASTAVATPPTDTVRSADSCVVKAVTDGDTFRCTDGRRVRLIGIDAPEMQTRPYGVRSRTALLALIPRGAAVTLETDVTPTDRYDRLLAYVWRDDRLVNERMVADGWAVQYTVPPNVKYAERFGRAQATARSKRLGLWRDGGFDCLPEDFRRKRCGDESTATRHPSPAEPR